MENTTNSPHSLSTLKEVARFAITSAESLIEQLPADEVIVPQTIHVRDGQIAHVSAFPTDALVEDGELIDAICGDVYQRQPEVVVSLSSGVLNDSEREIAFVSCFDRHGNSIGASFEFERLQDGGASIIKISYGDCSDDKLTPGLAGTMLFVGLGETEQVGSRVMPEVG